MNKCALKKAVLLGIPSAVATWIVYGLITMLLDRQPLGEVMFNTLGIVFVIVMGILEVMIYYRNRTDKKGADISSRRALLSEEKYSQKKFDTIRPLCYHI